MNINTRIYERCPVHYSNRRYLTSRLERKFTSKIVVFSNTNYVLQLYKVVVRCACDNISFSFCLLLFVFIFF